MSDRRLGLVVALLLAGVTTAEAQDAIIRGTVTSDRGDVVSSSLIQVLELNISVFTGANGQYTMVVPAARVRGQTVTVRARSIGFKQGTSTVTLSAGEHTADFRLLTDVNLLEAIVVTGVTAETQRKMVPWSAPVINVAVLPVRNIDALRQLQGKVPGVDIKGTSGRPGSPPAVLLRGAKSLNAQGRSQEPLYIVDGVIIAGSLPDLNPGDIETVEVLKGAAASSLYGAQAGRGIVQITTKRARGAEQVRFHARSEVGLSGIERDFGLARYHALMMDATNQFFCQSAAGQPTCARVFDYRTEVARINNVPGDFTPPAPGLPVDPGASTPESALRTQFQAKRWPGQTFNAVEQVVDPQPFLQNSIEMTGRFGSTSVFASAAHAEEGGAIQFLQGFERTSGRVNVDQRIGSDWSLALSTYYARTAQDGFNQERGGGAFFRLTRVPGIANILQRDTLGRLYIRPNLQASGAQNDNPLYRLENQFREDVSTRFIGGATVRYTPLEWLDADASFSYDSRKQNFEQITDKGYRATSSGFSASEFTGALGGIFKGDSLKESLNAGVGVTARREFLEGDLRARTNLRYSYQQQDFSTRTAQGGTLAVQGVRSLDNTTANRIVASGDVAVRHVGMSAGLNLEFKERYIADAVLRRDGSSLFGADSRWATFGRASLAWRVTQEPWWPLPQVSEFKLRASYGTAGERPRFDAQYETFTIGTGGVVRPVQLGNRNLAREITREVEAGAEVELFSRVLVDVTYARSETRDQILPAPVPSGSGFLTQWRNAGTVENRTWELAINLPIIQKSDLTWSLGFTYDRNRSVIKTLNVSPFRYGNTLQGTETIFYALEGEQIGSFYGRKFVTSCSELPAPFNAQCGGPTSAFQRNDNGYIVWVGAGNTWRDGVTENLWQEALPASAAPWGVAQNWGMPIIERDATGSAVQRRLGNALPDFRFSVSQNFQWRRLTLYALLDAAIGQDVWNQGRHWAHLDFLSKDIDQAGKSVETAKPIGYFWRAAAPDQAGLGGYYDILAPNNQFTEDASYAKLRELVLAYHVGPVRGVGDWEASVTGRNLFTITDYRGFDPEVGITGGEAQSASISAVDAFTFPNLRTLTFALSTSF